MVVRLAWTFAAVVPQMAGLVLLSVVQRVRSRWGRMSEAMARLQMESALFALLFDSHDIVTGSVAA